MRVTRTWTSPWKGSCGPRSGRRASAAPRAPGWSWTDSRGGTGGPPRDRARSMRWGGASTRARRRRSADECASLAKVGGTWRSADGGGSGDRRRARDGAGLDMATSSRRRSSGESGRWRPGCTGGDLRPGALRDPVDGYEEAMAARTRSAMDSARPMFTRDMNTAFRACATSRPASSTSTRVRRGRDPSALWRQEETGNGHREAGHAALDTFTEWNRSTLTSRQTATGPDRQPAVLTTAPAAWHREPRTAPGTDRRAGAWTCAILRAVRAGSSTVKQVTLNH